jgi:hypothetical protein
MRFLCLEGHRDTFMKSPLKRAVLTAHASMRARSSSNAHITTHAQAEFMSATHVRCRTPAVAASQLVSISLSLNAQDFSPSYLAKLFFFFPNPEVVRLLPPGGPAESGGSILVSGTGFLNTSTVLCRVGEVTIPGTYVNGTLMRCLAPQIQRKEYSAEVLRMAVMGIEVLPNSWRAYPVQGYPVEVSFDGQIFSVSNVMYTYYPSPQVDTLTPASGRKGDATVIVVSAPFNDNMNPRQCTRFYQDRWTHRERKLQSPPCAHE